MAGEKLPGPKPQHGAARDIDGIVQLAKLTIVGGLVFATSASVAGVVFVVVGASGNSQIQLFGQTIQTWNAGVACIFMAAVIGVVLVRPVWALLHRMVPNISTGQFAPGVSDAPAPPASDERSFVLVVREWLDDVIVSVRDLSSELTDETHQKRYFAKYFASVTKQMHRMKDMARTVWLREASTRFGDPLKESHALIETGYQTFAEIRANLKRLDGAKPAAADAAFADSFHQAGKELDSLYKQLDAVRQRLSGFLNHV